MADTFTWEHQAGLAGTITYRTREVQFGDGYSLSVQDGLNNEIQTWTVTVKGGNTLMQEVRAFYRNHAGSTSFLWTPPGESQALLFRASNISFTSHGGGVYSVTAEFKQVFVP